MRFVTAVSAFLSMLSVPALAAVEGKPIPLEIRCELQTGVDCQALQSGFFTTYGRLFERAAHPEDAEIHVRLTDQAISGGPTLFTFAWKASSALAVEDFTVTDRIDTTVHDSLFVLNELISDLGKGASLYLKVVHGEVNADGQLVITSGDSAPAKASSKLSQGPFFANIAVSASGAKSGDLQIFSGTAAANLNYSTDKVRLIVASAIGSTKYTVPSEDGTLSASNNTTAVGVTGAYSVRKRWSVALLGKYTKAPGQNIEADRETDAGIEWTLVPYRTTETREVYVRFGGGLRDLNLASENELGFDREQYALIFAQVYANWIFLQSKAKFSLSGSVVNYPKFAGYQVYSGSSSFFYQVTPAIQLSGSYSAAYQKKSLTYPKAPDYSNPIQSSFLTGAPGVSTSFSFGVNVTIGNSLRKSRDRRWSN